QGPPGATGATGATGLVWKGDWSLTTDYAVNDAVQSNGASYIAIRAGTNNQPDPLSSYSTLLADKGATGANGPTGATGAHGPTVALGPPSATGPTAPPGPTRATATTTPSPYTTLFRSQGPPGATGATGATGLVWKGDWSLTTDYAVNDAVQSNGASYIAIRAGTNNQPDPLRSE